MSTPSLAGRAAVVTGAGRGFGEQIAVELAALGAAVCALDVDAESGSRCAARIEAAGGRAVAVACNVADYDAVQTAFGRIRQELGEADILVNNAGIASFIPFLDTTEEEFDRVFAVNYSGTFNCCKAAVPAMVERRFGRIVNISSVAGKRGGGFLGRTLYSAAKAGVIGFTKALAKEVGRHCITANCVSPATTETDATRAWIQAQGEQIMRGYPLAKGLNRLGQPSDIANAVAFLASERAEWITGQVLSVNGGYSMVG